MTTIFAEILRDIVAASPGAQSAIFADREGEAVDLWTEDSTSDVKLCGAHWGVVHYLAANRSQQLGLGHPQEMLLRCSEQQIVLRSISVDYYVAVFLKHDGHLGRLARALDLAQIRLLDEIG